MKNRQKLKLWDAHVTPRNIQEVQASKLGDAPEAPLLHQKKIRSPFKTLYFYCFMHYAFFLERLYVCFQFCLVLFAAINCWTPTNFFWRRCTHFFHLPRTLCFSLLSFNECSLFLLLRLAFVFRLDFCSDLVLSLHQCVFGPLVYVGIHQKSCFKKVRMLLEKRKSFM
jgi:hypothetical protein